MTKRLRHSSSSSSSSEMCPLEDNDNIDLFSSS
ncbi:unnamed protein product, partial [Rotaria sp. Silwood2]